jgi:hypothetical protein
VEAASAVRYGSPVEPTRWSAVESANGATMESADRSANRARAESRASDESVAAPARASIESRAPVEAVEPGAGADEHPATEPVRTVVAVGRAAIRCIRVISVCANRGTRDDRRRSADSYSYHHALRVRERRGTEHQTEHCENP